MIQNRISFCKDKLETVIRNVEINWKKMIKLWWDQEIILMNPYDHLESLQTRRDEKRHLIIDNSEFLCDHGGLNPMNQERVNISQKSYTIK